MRGLILIAVLIAIGSSKVYIHDLDQNCIKILELPAKDSVFLNPVYFCTDSLGSHYYYSPLKTPVCNDTLCQVVFLNIFWDLGGNYSKFEISPQFPLTKNDHKPFSDQDYDKLDRTLKNETSVLGDKTEDELLDTDRSRYSEKIDGVTGATAKEIQSEIVEGALYSTYTLWHMTNGNIKHMLQEYTLSRFNLDLQQQLLESNNPKTIIFGLKNLEEEFYFTHFDKIISLMKQQYLLVNFYIAKNISQKVLDYGENKKELLKIWDLLDPNTKSVLSKYVKQ